MRSGERVGFGWLVACVLGLVAAAAEGQGTEPRRSARARQVLGLLDAELLELDLPPANAHAPFATQVRLAGRTELLELQATDVRAPGYQLLVEREDGSFAVPAPRAAKTYRGALAGQPGSRVAATLDERGLTARILLADGEEHYLEPLSGKLPDAARREHALYARHDAPAPGVPCAEPLVAPAETGAPATGEASTLPPDVASATTLKVAELAIDADYEYFLHWGQSVTAVEDRIHAVIDAMNLQYESEVGITHRITTVIVRTSPAQPYTATDPNALLDQLRLHWTANHAGVQRDLAHLFTGKQIDGSVIGIAWLGVVCNSSYGYGLSQSDFNANFASATDLTAHELGHNWSANHCTCPAYTMNPYITSTNTFEPTLSRPPIIAHRDSRTCLEDATTEPPPPPVPGRNLAVADHATAAGLVLSGSYASTHAQDGTCEVLEETAAGGKPATRKSQLVHTWRFDVQPGFGYSFHVDAHHSPNLEGDDFLFSYSRDGLAFVPMLTLTKTVADDALATYAFAEDVAGTLYVRVQDKDRTTGNGARDTVSVDQLFVQTQLGGADVTPPSAPAGLAATAGDRRVELDWSANREYDLVGYHVHRGTAPGGPYARLTAAPQGALTFTDLTVQNGVAYYYVVTAVDVAGNGSAASLEVRATPTPGGAPTTVHVAQVLVTTEATGGGAKRARADVVVADELGRPVGGALVTGAFSGGVAETLSGVTDATGAVTLRSSSTRKGAFTFTFCVGAVAHATLSYAPAENATTCASR